MNLSLTLYLALTGRAPAPEPAGFCPAPPRRPASLLLWLHASDRDGLAPLLDLVHHLLEERADLSFVLTGAARPEMAAHGFPECVLWADLPAERPQDAGAFLANWRPDLLIWAGAGLRPALIRAATLRGLPMVLVDALAARFSGIGLGWLPRLSRPLLRSFDTIYARDAEAARVLIRQGGRRKSVQVAGSLEQGGAPPPCEDAARNEMALRLATRPRWLALEIDESETGTILTTHFAISRLSHRMLLILAPHPRSAGAEVAARLARDGWSVVLRSRGEAPSEETQICIADAAGERGLWLRLSPISFMGGTLATGGYSSPFEAAALGSAILHGPKTDPFPETYKRLDRAGAARLLCNQKEMEQTLETLLAPDKVAIMANAAWEVASTGAEVTDRVTARILELLDQLETP